MTEQPSTGYKPGDVANGHVWTGTEWLRVQTPPLPAGPKSPWITLAGIACLIGAALAGIQGLSWAAGFSDLQDQGNQFAGILALLSMGALAVALAFGVWGVVLLKKK